MNISSQTSLLPIGIFDSGVGGLTVAQSVLNLMPNEHIVYLGDSARCPYGTRKACEVKEFATQIALWLERFHKGVKLIIIACNTATAAALPTIQQLVSVPVIGVIQPGARAALKKSRSRKIGVIATHATVSSRAYVRALTQLDAGACIYQKATPSFVNLVEHIVVNATSVLSSQAFETPEVIQCIHEELDGFLRKDFDTLVLGCTHFPFIESALARVTQPLGITLVNSAYELALEVHATLSARGQLRHNKPTHQQLRFFTTGAYEKNFSHVVRMMFPNYVICSENISSVTIQELQQGE